MARQLLGVEHVSIAFAGRDAFHTKSSVGAIPAEYSRFESFCSVAIETPGTLVVSDATTHPLFKDNPRVLGGQGVRFYAGHSLEGPGGERVGTICVADTEPREFTEEHVAILRDLAVWVQEELAHAHEMSDSTQVQRGLLPQTLVTLQGYEVAGMLQPVRDVSGDFYDWYPVRGGAAFTLADAMGKGVPAALMAATVRATMRAGSRFDGVAAAVESADEALEADLDGVRTFVTLFHAHLEEETGTLRYIDAGHGLTLLVHADGTSERLASTGLPLGVGWEATWEESEVQMRHGDFLVSVSDGVLDGLGGALDALDRVEEAVRSASDATSAVAAIAALIGAVPPDDVTLLVVRREPGFRS
jgi:serine phosphatase RsbU (regulator of sigma subunit)